MVYGWSICQQIVFALLAINAEKLKEEHDIQSIPHALPAEAYESILTGMQPQAAVQALLDRPRKGRKRASLTLEADEAENVDSDARRIARRRLAIAPAAAGAEAVGGQIDDGAGVFFEGEGDLLGGEQVDDRDDDGDGVDDDELIAELEALIDAQPAEDPDGECEDTSAPAAAPSASSAGHVSVSAEAASDTGVPETPEPLRGEVVVAPGPDAADHATPSARRERKSSAQAPPKPRLAPWGPFSLHRKSAQSSPPFGGIQIVCPFHALNDKSGCKKFLSLSGPQEADEENVLNRLRHWANQAQRFDRQRKHVRMSIREADTPAPAVVLQQKLEHGPSEAIRNDVQLDAEASASSAAPKAAAAGRPKARAARAKAAGSAKNKAQAKARSLRVLMRPLQQTKPPVIPSPVPTLIGLPPGLHHLHPQLNRPPQCMPMSAAVAGRCSGFVGRSLQFCGTKLMSCGPSCVLAGR